MRSKHLATPCPASFLSLPLELRQQVYRHLLPTTYLRNASSLEWGAQSLVPVWLKGNTSVPRVNRQFYSEAIELLFGDATLALAIYHDWVDFCFRTLHADGKPQKILQAVRGPESSSNTTASHPGSRLCPRSLQRERSR